MSLRPILGPSFDVTDCYSRRCCGPTPISFFIRSPFSLGKIRITDPAGSIVYRSEINPKIKRNFEVFSPADFIAAVTQHIPDKNFQLVRYYGWYSNPDALRDRDAASGRNGRGSGERTCVNSRLR